MQVVEAHRLDFPHAKTEYKLLTRALPLTGLPSKGNFGAFIESKSHFLDRF